MLGLVTKSILKICILQQLGVLGHAACSELQEGTHVTATKKMYYISKGGYKDDRQPEIRLGQGLSLLHAVIIE